VHRLAAQRGAEAVLGHGHQVLDCRVIGVETDLQERRLVVGGQPLRVLMEVLHALDVRQVGRDRPGCADAVLDRAVTTQHQQESVRGLLERLLGDVLRPYRIPSGVGETTRLKVTWQHQRERCCGGHDHQPEADRPPRASDGADANTCDHALLRARCSWLCVSAALRMRCRNSVASTASCWDRTSRELPWITGVRTSSASPTRPTAISASASPT
jgi:hypothetical protein